MASKPYASQNRRGNQLLAALPQKDQERLTSLMKKVSLEIKDVVWEPNKPIENIYFPLTGVMSILSVMDDGLAAEIATVGSEGMVGLPVFLGAQTTPVRAVTQVPGEMLRMPAQVFKEEIGNEGALTALLHRYTQAMFVQIGQSAACNRLHSIEERCARWLLMTHDRVGTDKFPMTQEFLSQMVGVRRARVNTVARIFQRAGLIRYARGTITVLDRKGLEEASCECYRVIKDEYDRLMT